MRIIKLSMISVLVLGLSACTTVSERYGFLKDENQNYKKAPALQGAVVMPQNMATNEMQDYYEVPETAPSAVDAQPSLAPPGSSLAQRQSQPQVPDQNQSKPGQPVMLSQQDKIRSAENAKIQGHTFYQPASTSTTVGMNFSQAWVKVGHVLQASNYKIVEKDNVLGTYYVVDMHGTGGKLKKDMPIYQVHLKAAGRSTQVSVSPSNPALQNQINRNLNG